MGDRRFGVAAVVVAGALACAALSSCKGDAPVPAPGGEPAPGAAVGAKPGAAPPLAPPVAEQAPPAQVPPPPAAVDPVAEHKAALARAHRALVCATSKDDVSDLTALLREHGFASAAEYARELDALVAEDPAWGRGLSEKADPKTCP